LAKCSLKPLILIIKNLLIKAAYGVAMAIKMNATLNGCRQLNGANATAAQKQYRPPDQKN
jgi:hypothetical protein